MEGSTAAATTDRFNQPPTECREPGCFDAVNAGRLAAMRSIRRRVNRVRLGCTHPSRHACRRASRVRYVADDLIAYTTVDIRLYIVGDHK